ncbi:MAG TPA: PAS domain S-box protein [Rubrobacteraceae bacterium]|nr:PAS domain S-box protein [Rubrobacteraceae bacterium]
MIEALKESEEQFAIIVQNALDIVMITEADGSIRYITPSVERILGYMSEEMVGTNIAEYVHPEDLEMALRELGEAVSRPGVYPVAVETRVRRKDGSWRYLEGIANNLLGDPDVRGMVFNHRDVTDRVRAEAEVRRLNEELEDRVAERTAQLEAALAERERTQRELKRSRDELEVILRGVADGITAQDSAGRLIYANDAAAKIMGYPSARDLLQALPAEVMRNLEIRDEAGNPYPLERLPGRTAIRTRQNVETILRFRQVETGEERWTVVRSAPVLDERGDSRFEVNIFHDITDRERADIERRQLSAIVESSDDAIISKTLDGTITSWNSGAQKIYGYSAEETVGMPISMLVPDDRPNEIPGILERLSRGEKIDHYETVRVTKDGRRLDISVTISPIRNSAGRIVGASAIARDITERKQAEDAMRRIREAERHRIARDLHDSVLQDIAYTLQTLEVTKMKAEGTDLEEELVEEVGAMRTAARGLRNAVYELRLGDERNRPLVRLVKDLVEQSRQRSPGCEIELDLRPEVSVTPLGDNGTELLRIIQEALTNVRRHSGARRVLVRLRVDGEYLVAEVVDDGHGFGPEVDAGVGTRSMNERAAALGGELRVESEPGRGTRVRLRVAMSALLQGQRAG